MNMWHWWNYRLQEKSELLVENPLPFPTYPPQILHGPPWERTWLSAVRSLSYGRPISVSVSLLYNPPKKLLILN
jgi:hypothetical protein